MKICFFQKFQPAGSREDARAVRRLGQILAGRTHKRELAMRAKRELRTFLRPDRSASTARRRFWLPPTRDDSSRAAAFRSHARARAHARKAAFDPPFDSPTCSRIGALSSLCSRARRHV